MASLKIFRARPVEHLLDRLRDLYLLEAVQVEGVPLASFDDWARSYLEYHPVEGLRLEDGRCQVKFQGLSWLDLAPYLAPQIEPPAAPVPPGDRPA